ncbi:MAG TPA: sulfite exporter TauE/SafE family protein, partial [Paraburkholderia sp.]|nr:sulfite exporter TauE/SafE family protein [Paraburkholderia sp.]
MSVFSLSPYSDLTVTVLLVILVISAITSGLSGFGFSAIGAASLWVLPPQVGVPLLMALSSANQLLSLRQIHGELKPLREWWPDGPAPFILGGLLGIPIGLVILHALPTPALMIAFGAFLVGYAGHSIFRSPARRATKGGWRSSVIVGVLGGIIGGFTAFPGAIVVLWIGRQGLSKQESRAIVQPYIFAMQLLALTMLAIKHPSTFDIRFWSLFAVTVVAVLPGTFLGVRIYKSLSEINFRRVCFSLLGMSGLAILSK